MAPRKPRFQRNSFLRRYPAASGLAPSPTARSCPGRMTHQRGPHNPSDGNPLYRKAFNCNYTFGTGTEEWFITCTGFKESKYRFQRTSTWQKTRITRQLSIMKTPPRLIGWLRSTTERAIMHQARSTRRPPSITLARHTKPRRRLTKNLNIRSSLQLELNLPTSIQDLDTGRFLPVVTGVPLLRSKPEEHFLFLSRNSTECPIGAGFSRSGFRLQLAMLRLRPVGGGPAQRPGDPGTFPD